MQGDTGAGGENGTYWGSRRNEGVRWSAKEGASRFLPPEARKFLEAPKLHTVTLCPRAETLLLCATSLPPIRTLSTLPGGKVWVATHTCKKRQKQTKNRHFIRPRELRW